jgi:hypothetical protein
VEKRHKLDVGAHCAFSYTEHIDRPSALC